MAVSTPQYSRKPKAKRLVCVFIFDCSTYDVLLVDVQPPQLNHPLRFVWVKTVAGSLRGFSGRKSREAGLYQQVPETFECKPCASNGALILAVTRS